MLSEPETLEVKDLLRRYKTILDRLRELNVIRTENSPVGDYAEWLVARRLNLTLMRNSSTKYDAIGTDGIRYQIKARRLTEANKSTQLGVFRNLELEGFDQLIVVLFDANFEIHKVFRIPHKIVVKYAKERKYINGHLLFAQGELLKESAVEDLTSQFADST